MASMRCVYAKLGRVNAIEAGERFGFGVLVWIHVTVFVPALASTTAVRSLQRKHDHKSTQNSEYGKIMGGNNTGKPALIAIDRGPWRDRRACAATHIPSYRSVRSTDWSLGI